MPSASKYLKKKLELFSDVKCIYTIIHIFRNHKKKYFEKSSSYQRCQLHHHDGGTQRQPNTQTWLSQPGDYQYIYVAANLECQLV